MTPSGAGHVQPGGPIVRRSVSEKSRQSVYVLARQAALLEIRAGAAIQRNRINAVQPALNLHSPAFVSQSKTFVRSPPFEKTESGRAAARPKRAYCPGAACTDGSQGPNKGPPE